MTVSYSYKFEIDDDGLLILEKGHTVSNQGVHFSYNGQNFLIPYAGICKEYAFHPTGELWEQLSKLPVQGMRLRMDSDAMKPFKGGFIKTAVRIRGVVFDLKKLDQYRTPMEVEHLNPDHKMYIMRHPKLQCAWYPANEKGQIQIKIETLVPDNPGSHIKTRFFHSIWIPKKNIFLIWLRLVSTLSGFPSPEKISNNRLWKTSLWKYWRSWMEL